MVRKCPLLGERHFFPKTDVTGKVCPDTIRRSGSQFVVGKSPILIRLTLEGNRVVLALPFPRTGLRSGARGEVPEIDTGRWEIPVSFNANQV